MNEREFVKQIDRITREAPGVATAVRQIETLLAEEYGGALLMIRGEAAGAALGSVAILNFLDTRRFPFRGLYTSRIPSRGGSVATTLVACIGTWGTPGEVLRRVVHAIGQSLSALAVRFAPEFAEAAQ